jgi:hypothetical protein
VNVAEIESIYGGNQEWLLEASRYLASSRQAKSMIVLKKGLKVRG